MKNSISLVFVVSFFVLTSCTSASKSTGGGFFSSSKFNVQDYETKTLKNGLTLIYVKDESLPRVGISALVKTGLPAEPEGKAGVNSMVASMLDQGTTTKNAIQISDAFNSLGTEFQVDAASDGVVFSADSLSSDANALVELFAEVLMKPSFKTQEVNRLKNQRVASLKKRIDNPSSYSRLKFNEFLNQGTPYERDTAGTIPSVQGMKQTDMIRFYLANYRPNNSVISLTGRFDNDLKTKIESIFGEWTKRDIKEAEIKNPVAPEKLEVKLVTKRGLAQAQILFGRPSVQRAEADYLALRVANEAFGGGFGARLMQKVRDDLGLTYSAYSSVTSGRTRGVFQISTFTKNQTTGQMVTEVLKVYNQFVAEGINENELKAAKAQIIGQYPRGLETADAVASGLMTLNLLGMPYDEIEKMPGKIEALSLKEVNAAIQKHFSKDALKVLVYADRNAVLPQLKEFNPTIELAR